METTELAESCLVHVQEFQSQNGANGEADRTLSQWCCEQLEEGRILHFESLPFDFPEEDRQFLISQHQSDSHLHKNISYRPQQDLLRGFPGENGSAHHMHEVMRRYSQQVLKFLSRLLEPYASQWSLDYASFRSEAEQSGKLPLHKRNDLLHVDAFPSRPTSGGRILRCFTNINPTEPRIWQTTESFSELARKHAYSAGLAHFADNHSSGGLETVLRNFGRALGFKSPTSSPYDKFMQRFHNYLKENTAFQEHCGKIRLEFAPLSTWISFTDAVPHAVIYGQYAVEQTVIVPMHALLAPEKSPLRTLENLVGRPLTRQSPIMTAHA